MKVSRVYDPTPLNRVLNHKEILSYVAPGYESFDLTDFIKDRENVVLRVGPAFSIFARQVDGSLDGHFLFPPEVKGKKALDSAKKMIDYVFTNCCVSAIHGHTPRKYRAARVMSRALGFKPIGASRNLADQDCVHYKLERNEWERFSA